MRCIALFAALFLLVGCTTQESLHQTSLEYRTVPKQIEIQKVSETNFVISGFYPYWEQSKFPPNIVIDKELDIVYRAFAWPDKNGNLYVPNNFDNSFLISLVHKDNIKLLISIGGGNTSRNISMVLSNPITFKNFLNSTVSFVKSNQYNGVNIDWEFPKSNADMTNLDNFVKALRTQLGNGYIISIDLPTNNFAGRYFDIDFLDEYTNYYIIMTYDYSGAWSKISGYNAPLKTGFCNTHDIQKSIEYWLARKIQPNKILLGIAFYGRAFDADEPCQEFNKSYAVTYRNILSLIRKNDYKYFWDFMTKTPYIINKKHKVYYSFDDLSSIRDKIHFAFDMHLGGIAIWEITQDIINDKHDLLPQIAQIIKNNYLINEAPN